MEQQFLEWFKAHRRDIVVAAISSVLTAKLLPRKTVAYVQDAEGKGFWVMPTKQ